MISSTYKKHGFLVLVLVLISLVKSYSAENLPLPANPCNLDEDRTCSEQPEFLGQTRSFTLGYIREICKDLHDDIAPVRSVVKYERYENNG